MDERISESAARAVPVRVPKFDRPGVWPRFPDDPRDGTAWNLFWRGILDSDPAVASAAPSLLPGTVPTVSVRQWLDEFYVEPLAALRMDCADHRYRAHFDTFHQLGAKRILFAGNGVSVLPYMAAHCGFTALGMDISEAATVFARDHPPEEKYFVRFFTLGIPVPGGPLPRGAASAGRASARAARQARLLAELRQIVERARHADGAVDFTLGDLFDYEPGDASFGAAVVQNVVEHFPAAERGMLARRLYRWLRPGGILVVESQYLTELGARGLAGWGVEHAFESAGFVFHLKEAYRWLAEQSQARWWQVGKVARLSGQRHREMIQAEFTRRAAEQREADFDQLRGGGKLVLFQYGR